MKRIYGDEQLSCGDSFSWSPNKGPEEFVSFYKNQGVTRVFVHDRRDDETAAGGSVVHPADLPYVIHLANGSTGPAGNSTIHIILNNETYSGPEIGFTSRHGSFTFSVHHNRTAKTAAHV